MNMACISWPGEGAGGEGAGSQHSFFLIQVLQLSVAEISNILRLSRNERCPPEEYLWHGEASSWQSPGSAEQSRPGKLQEVHRQWDRARSPPTGWTREKSVSDSSSSWWESRISPRMKDRSKCMASDVLRSRPLPPAPAEGRSRGAEGQGLLLRPLLGPRPDRRLEERLQDPSPGKQEYFHVEVNLVSDIRCLAGLVLLPIELI